MSINCFRRARVFQFGFAVAAATMMAPHAMARPTVEVAVAKLTERLQKRANVLEEKCSEHGNNAHRLNDIEENDTRWSNGVFKNPFTFLTWLRITREIPESGRVHEIVEAEIGQLKKFYQTHGDELAAKVPELRRQADSDVKAAEKRCGRGFWKHLPKDQLFVNIDDEAEIEEWKTRWPGTFMCGTEGEIAAVASHYVLADLAQILGK